MAPSYTAVVLAAALLPISNALLTVGPPALARRPAFGARRTVKSSIDEPSRRDVLTTLARGLAASVAAPLVAVAAEEGVPSASYEGYGGMALGAGTMASKTRPESGVVLRDEPSRGDDGIISAELVTKDGKVIATSFLSPWKLAQGMNYDVEVRDKSTGDSAYLQVEKAPSAAAGGDADIASVPNAFLQDRVFKSDGRYGAYGQPTDIKIVNSVINPTTGFKELEFKFSALSPTYAEVPRRAVVSATLKGDDVVMLVGGSTQSRWGKGGEQVIRPIVGSFRASLFTPAKAAKAKDQGFQAGVRGTQTKFFDFEQSACESSLGRGMCD